MPLTPTSKAQSRVEASSLPEFRSLVSSSFVPLRVSTEHDSAFGASVVTADADEVVFTEVRALPHLVERTPETITAGGSGYYKMSLLLEGSSILVQDGKELVMRPGDLSVYDTSRPYSLLFAENFRNLILMFPKDRVEIPTHLTDQLTAVSFAREHGALSSVIASFLSQFPGQLAELPGQVRAKLGHTSLDLVSTLFSTVLDAGSAHRDPHQVMLQQICRYIDTHLGSPDLSPSSIAAAHYISTRHLHALFAEADTTVSTWVRERRLERCRTDLLDPALGDRTVASIARRWGFVDAAHFSRAFKASFGVSPRELRRSL